MASKDFTLEGADHTGITVESLPKALAFWHDLLGLDILYQTRFQMDLPNPVGVANSGAKIALLSMPGGHKIELLEYTSPSDRTTMKPRSCDVGSVHLAVGVTGIEAVLEGAKKLGWTAAMEKPAQFKRGDGSMMNVTYIWSPDGIAVELMEKLDA